MSYLLQSGEAEAFNWNNLLFGDQDHLFLLEIIVRTVVMYLVMLTGLRLMGKRGVRQLSVFELVVIIGLGSAAGDPMFYKEVGLVSAIAVFVVIISVYRATTYLTAKSKRFEKLVEGETVCLIDEGRFCFDCFDKEDLAQDEFFSELRVKGISQLGQIKKGYLEMSGDLSLFYYEEEDVKEGLPILPEKFKDQFKIMPENDLYACTHCGKTKLIQKNASHRCSVCDKDSWIKAVKWKRTQ